mmetsp:Transcript_13690/g.51197  ORF Transcript_13690/g.51197 Transcript_13690/m.51197 type:complete len:213 (+) Transcript_13690:408-1046(+)
MDLQTHVSIRSQKRSQAPYTAQTQYNTTPKILWRSTCPCSARTRRDAKKTRATPFFPSKRVNAKRLFRSARLRQIRPLRRRVIRMVSVMTTVSRQLRSLWYPVPAGTAKNKTDAGAKRRRRLVKINPKPKPKPARTFNFLFSKTSNSRNRWRSSTTWLIPWRASWAKGAGRPASSSPPPRFARYGKKLKTSRRSTRRARFGWERRTRGRRFR